MKHFLYKSLLFCGALLIFLSACNNQRAPVKNFSSDQYRAFFDKALNALVNNEPEELEALMSEGLKKRSQSELSQEQFVRFLNEHLIAFFSDFKKLDPAVTSTITADADGNPGFAFYRVFMTNDLIDKAFAVYIVEEQGQLKLGNIVVGKTYREMQELMKKSSPKE